MIPIIRNVLIIKNSVLLLSLNFGECFSLKSNENLIASFLSAFNILSNEIFGTSIMHINYEDYVFHFYKDQDFTNTYFIIFADSYEEPEVISFKFGKIALLFKERYSEILKNFRGNTSYFKDFKRTLIEMHVAKNNCGKHAECTECPENTKISEIFSIFKEKRERFLAFFQKALKKT